MIMKKRKILIIISAILLCSLALIFFLIKFGRQEKQYDESSFQGSGIIGVPDLLDMVGYATNLDSFEYAEDGSVALKRSYAVPLRHSTTENGFHAKLSVECADGKFDAMTSSANTGALYVYTETIRHRIYVIGNDDETGYIVVAGVRKQSSGNFYDYFERRYLIPLGNYCTGAPIDLDIVYYKNAYDITINCDGTKVFKRIAADTEYMETSGRSSEMSEFFEDGTRILGLEAMEVSARFRNVQFDLENEHVESAVTNEVHKVKIENKDKSKGSVETETADAAKGEQVYVNIKPEEGCYLKSFTVNGLDCKGAIEVDKNGRFRYTIIGIQCDTVIRAVFASGEETKYLVTGSYAYTSGDYNKEQDSFENNGDVVSVQAGMYQGTVENGKFSIGLPKGVFKLKLNSDKFPTSITQVVVVDEDIDLGEIEFKRLNFTTSVDYNADDSLTFNANQTTRLFDEKAFNEGWVVHYTVQGAKGGWFNTGGLYMLNEDGSYDYMFIYSQNGKAEVVMIESDQRIDNGPVYKTTYDYAGCLNKIKVTIAYYQGVYHIILDDVYACTIDADTTLDTQQGTLTEEFFAEKARILGLRNYDSAATFTDVSYAIGVDAARKVVREKTVAVNATSAQQGELQLLSDGKEIGLNSIQTLGTNVTPVITVDKEYYIDRFLVNEKDCASLLTGPYTSGDKYIYKCNLKATKGGLNIDVSYTKQKPELQMVSGSYSYPETLAEGSITVSAGTYTGSAKDGRFEIALPKGTHIVTLVDSNGVYATQEVIVEDKKVTDVNFVLQDINYEDVKNVSMTGNGFAITRKGGFHYAEIPGGITAAEGFSVVYTVKGQNEGWFNGGGLYFEKDGVKHTIFVKSIGGNAVIMLLQPNVGTSFGTANYSTNYAYSGNEEIRVTVVYYNQVLYIQLGDGQFYAIQTPDNMTQYGYEIDQTFFSFGYRTLGFVAMDANATFTDVSYTIGNDSVERLYPELTK